MKTYKELKEKQQKEINNFNKDFESNNGLLENYKIARDRYIKAMNKLGW